MPGTTTKKDIDFDALIAAETGERKGGWVRFAIAASISLIWLLPFYYLAITIFKSTEEYALKNPLALPDGVFPFVENVIRETSYPSCRCRSDGLVTRTWLNMSG